MADHHADAVLHFQSPQQGLVMTCPMFVPRGQRLKTGNVTWYPMAGYRSMMCWMFSLIRSTTTTTTIINLEETEICYGAEQITKCTKMHHGTTVSTKISQTLCKAIIH